MAPQEVEALKRQLEAKEKELEVLRQTPIKSMWESDLDAFVDELLKVCAAMETHA